MKTFTVSHNVVHLWKGQKRAEGDRVSQVLLGATVSVLDEAEGGAWVYIQGDDTYRGWTERALLMTPDPNNGERSIVSRPFADVRDQPNRTGGLEARLSIGSRLTMIEGDAIGWRRVAWETGAETIRGWVRHEALERLPIVRFPEEIPSLAVYWASDFLGTPYLWGGSSAFGLDCSGLAQLCYRLAGIILRRDADIQRSDPRFVPIIGERQAGDLVFFGNKETERITHVGLDLGDGRFIHAAGGLGVIITAWEGDTRFAPTYIDARRLDFSRAGEPVTRHESETR